MIVDSYSESNEISNTSGVVGQSFTGNGSVLDKAQFFIRKFGSPVGNVYAKIYAHSGTFGVNGVPTGSPLATSEPVDSSSISTSYSLVDFVFTGANKITLANGTKYFVTYEHTLTAPNYLLLGQDTTSPTHAGNRSWYNGVWNGDNDADLCFYVYGEEEEEEPVIVDPPPDPEVPNARIAIAKKGKSALSTNPNDFIFHSDYNTFKIISEPLINITLEASTTDQTFTYPHGLPFVPLVRGMAKQSGINTAFFPNSENVSGWNEVLETASNTGVKFNYIESDDTNIILNFDNDSSSSVEVSVRAYCLEGIYEGVLSPNNGTPSGNRVVVAKPGYNAKTEIDPRNLKFSSEYGSLKYLYKAQQNVALDAAISSSLQAHLTINHNFGYYLYTEPFVRVYIGDPSGDFEPAPFKGSGVSVPYDAKAIITPNTIELYVQIDGVSFSLWNFEFILFIYRNNLNL